MSQEQNSYGEIELCSRCNQPLEKARVGSYKGRGVCLECQRKYRKEYNEKRKQNESHE